MTPKSLQYATSIVPTIATSTSPQTNATHATLVATTTIAVPHCVPHHRGPTSGATIIVVLADTALPSAEPNSQTRTIFNSYNNSRSRSKFLLTTNLLSSMQTQHQKNVSIPFVPKKRHPCLSILLRLHLLKNLH